MLGDKLTDMRLRDLLSDDEYLINKQRLFEERKAAKEKLDALEGRTNSWIDTCEQAFDFAKSARFAFENGTLQEKREIVTALGSNFVLQDKILSINLHKPFQVISNKKQEAKRLELPILGLGETKKQPLEREIIFWQGLEEFHVASLFKTTRF